MPPPSLDIMHSNAIQGVGIEVPRSEFVYCSKCRLQREPVLGPRWLASAAKACFLSFDSSFSWHHYQLHVVHNTVRCRWLPT